MKMGKESLIMSKRASRLRRLGSLLLKGILFVGTSLSMIAVLFIIFFIAKDAIPFFKLQGIKEFLGSIQWYPAGHPPKFGALAIFYGSIMVTLGSSLVAIPLGISAAICLSDILPFSIRQMVKPVLEILAALPSVAYGFFALVVFAPILQKKGGHLLAVMSWVILLPVGIIVIFVLSDIISEKFKKYNKKAKILSQIILSMIFLAVLVWAIFKISGFFNSVQINSGTNALNVSIILGIMALPTVVSVSEDALQAAGRELREGSYALGATRAETIFKVIVPAASSGIVAAVILGVMRAIGETMVVWMASGNSAHIPEPFYNFFSPVRTLTATIAGDMGEADQVTGSSRYHVLFAMALSLLLISFIANLISEWAVVRSRKKLRGENE